jgi:hypothetical protein
MTSSVADLFLRTTGVDSGQPWLITREWIGFFRTALGPGRSALFPQLSRNESRDCRDKGGEIDHR